MSSRPAPPAPASLLRNTAWVSAGNLLVKPAWLLFITAVCMRRLGPDEYGTLTVALALALTTASIADLGLANFSVREVARRRELASEYFSNVLIGRLGTAAAAGVLTVGIGVALGYESGQLAALIGACMYAAGLQAAEFCRSFFRAYEVLRHEAVSIVVERVVVIGTGTAGLVLWGTAAGALGGMAVGMILSFGLVALSVHHRIAPLHVHLIRLSFLRQAIRRALPIGLLGLFTSVLLGAPPLVIEYTLGKAAAGHYGAAYRLIEASMLLPSVVCAAVLPRLSSVNHRGDHAEFFRVLWRSGTGLALAAAGVALFYGAASFWIMSALAGDAAFGGAATVLRVMATLFPVMSLSMLYSLALVSADEQGFVAVLVGSVAALNLIGTILLIPSAGPEGAAGLLVLSHTVLAAACYLRLQRLRRAKSGTAVSLTT